MVLDALRHLMPMVHCIVTIVDEDLLTRVEAAAMGNAQYKALLGWVHEGSCAISTYRHVGCKWWQDIDP